MIRAVDMRAVNRSRTLMNIFHKKPELGRETFVAPSASLIGRVTLGDQASVFYGSVLRGASYGFGGGLRTQMMGTLEVWRAFWLVG